MFTKAIVKIPAKTFANGITSSNLENPDYNIVLKQHNAYCEALIKCGLELIILNASPDYPDSCFVEDTAIVTKDFGVITRPEDKIHAIATKMYGADHVEYTVKAKNKLKKITELGFGNLAVCIAKTQKLLSDGAHKKGRPRGFTVKIREVELSSGAGFIVPIAGTIMRMPGLPSKPSAEKIDIDENGNITGLF